GDVHGARDSVLLREVVRAEDGRGRATRRRAALIARERVEDLVTRHDLFDGPDLVEQRVRIQARVLARLRADLREGLAFGTVFPPILAPRAAEHLRGRRRLGEALHVIHHRGVLLDGTRAIGEFRPERALLHLLEADRERALDEPAFDRLLRE